jgi:hypothetical protein
MASLLADEASGEGQVVHRVNLRTLVKVVLGATASVTDVRLDVVLTFLSALFYGVPVW